MSDAHVLAAFGHLSARMLAHILLMNAVAPLLALAASRMLGLRWSPTAGRPLVFPAMLVQLALLWGWHAPPVLDATMRSETLHVSMQASLLLSAAWFWSAVLSRDEAPWRAVVALLVTSKLFCLLGVLLVFAPRALYAPMQLADGSGQGIALLADQQLAGLVMLVACPITYLVAGVVIAARWLRLLEANGEPVRRRQNARHAV